MRILLIVGVLLATSVFAASPNNTVVLAGSTASIIDAGGNAYTIKSGQVAVGGIADATTLNVIEIAYVNGLVWQENSAKLWWSRATPTSSWAGGTSTSPLVGGGLTVSAAISWSAPTANVDGSAITGAVSYNLYQGLTGALAKVQSGIAGGSATVTTGLTPGTTQCFAVTAVVATLESAQSVPVCITLAVPPPPTPVSPTNVTITLK